MKALFFSTALFTALFAAVQAKVSYDGHKVVRVAHTDSVKDLIKRHALDTWGKDNGFIDVVLPRGLELSGALMPRVMHRDLGASIAEEAKYNVYAAPNATYFTSYHAYADHLQFLKDLQTAFPTRSEIVQVGNSLEGRVITGIHIWGASKGANPAAIIHGGVHAREWISPMVVEYLAYSFLNNYASDSALKTQVDKLDLYLLPIVNPDGFVYTQTDNRLWRKNRRAPTSSCPGTDINRNWAAHWNCCKGAASTDPCAEDYQGQAAADAPETQVLQNFAKKLQAGTGGVKLFIDFHSYSQVWNWPYNYACDVTAANDADLAKAGNAAAAAIKAVNGKVFETGPGCPGLYATSGESSDYHYDVIKATYSYTVELRDTGTYGFVLPANQITPSGQETFAGVKALLTNMK